VVLRGVASTQELRAFCSTHLADFKVPDVIRIVSALPKDAIEKVQRRDLAANIQGRPDIAGEQQSTFLQVFVLKIRIRSSGGLACGTIERHPATTGSA